MIIRRENNEWDFYKGLLMFGVILGHCINAYKADSVVSSWVSVFIRSYDMPMFAFVSGIFLQKSCRKYSVWQNILNKITSIMCPILLWNLLDNLFLRHIAWYKLTGGFWFLWSILIVSIFIILVDAGFAKLPVLKPILFLAIFALLSTVITDKYYVAFLFLPAVVGYYYEQISDILYRPKTQLFLALSFLLLECFWTADYNIWHIGTNIFAFGTPLITSAQILFRTLIGIVGSLEMMVFWRWIYCYDFSDSLKATATKIRTFLCGGGKKPWQFIFFKPIWSRATALPCYKKLLIIWV